MKSEYETDFSNDEQNQTQQVYPVQQGSADTISTEDRLLSTLCHLSYLTVAGFVLIPLLVWLLKRSTSTWLANNAKQALVYQIGWSLAGIVSLVFSKFIILFTLGLGAIIAVPLVIAVGCLPIIPTLIAVVYSWQGKTYRYPIVGSIADQM